MGVHLLDHLREQGPGLVRARDVVEKDVLGRVGYIDRPVRLVERVLAGREDSQRRAIRAELRPYGFACNEVRVCSQPWIQILLD